MKKLINRKKKNKNKFEVKVEDIENSKQEDMEEDQRKINLNRNSKFLNQDKYTNQQGMNLANIPIIKK